MRSLALNLTKGEKNVRTGFHVPPFNSVHHLHMHVIVPPFKSWYRNAKYPLAKRYKWFLTSGDLLESLKALKDGETWHS
jgi:Scavenger mRNA decapping enzyme C-term binding